MLGGVEILGHNWTRGPNFCFFADQLAQKLGGELYIEWGSLE
jgi:hypothetical protein